MCDYCTCHNKNLLCCYWLLLLFLSSSNDNAQKVYFSQCHRHEPQTLCHCVLNIVAPLTSNYIKQKKKKFHQTCTRYIQKYVSHSQRHTWLLFAFQVPFFFSRTIREGSACCANVLCQEAVRYWLQGCMTLMGFDRSPRGPELSQAGACFRLQGPWVTLLKACIPPCAWMPPNTSFKAASAERTAGLRNTPPIL